MSVHRVVALLLLSMVMGCASARVVRLDTGRGEPRVFTPRADEAGPVELGKAELQAALSTLSRSVRPPGEPARAARRLFEVEARGGAFAFDARTRRVTPLVGTELVSETEVELTRAYLRWCERTRRPGDCLRLLVEGPTVDRDGRFVLALALAQGAVLEELLEAFKDMADPQAMLSAALWTGTMYLILWSVPEPTSKGLAAVMTASLIAYVGVDTFWGLITGFQRLMDEADRATTFEGLREAGERYGKVMGRQAARAFALLATVAIGNTAAGFASRLPTLPGSAQAGLALSVVGEVEAVAVTSGTLTFTLAPGAVAMAGASVDAQGHLHHIATDKWWSAAHSDGPWSPEFQRVFDKAGMSLNDPANLVRIPGHQGPHPKEYHQRILDRLRAATAECRTMQQCREALTAELKRLARQISTEGTELNKLVTRSE